MISVKIGHSDNNQGKVIKAMQKRLKREEAERQRIKDIRKDIKQAERLEQQMWG